MRVLLIQPGGSRHVVGLSKLGVLSLFVHAVLAMRVPGEQS
jgi:hypothetical protein